MMKKMIYIMAMGLMVVCSATSKTGASAPSVLAVNFDCSEITKTAYVGDGYSYLGVILPGTLSGYYIGQPIYHGLDKKHGGGNSDLSAASIIYEDQTWGRGGILLQWNGDDPQTGQWDEGDVSTAVFMFKKEDFLNGLNEGSIVMDAANDMLRAGVEFQPKQPSCLKSATFRWVVQDADKYYISTPIPFTTATVSEVELTARAKEVIWHKYNPEGDITAISAKASPSLKDIGMIGFQISAVCRANVAERKYPNVRVNSFSAEAITSANSRKRR